MDRNRQPNSDSSRVFDELLDAFCDDRLDEAGRQRLAELLKASDEACRRYIDVVHLCVSLSYPTFDGVVDQPIPMHRDGSVSAVWRYLSLPASVRPARKRDAQRTLGASENEAIEPANSPDRKNRQREALARREVRDFVFGDSIDPNIIASLLNEEEAAAERRRAISEQASIEQTVERRGEMLDRKLLRVEERRMPASLVYAGIAVVAILLVMVGRWIGPASTPLPQAPIAAIPAPVNAPTPAATAGPPTVATISRTFDAKLMLANEPIVAGAKLASGTLVLEQGVAEVQFLGGAKLVIEGPAEFELMTPERAKLVRGKAVAYVPPEAIGFTLHSEAAAFVDLGTEFGVEIGDDGLTNIHVLDGEVALVSQKKGNAPSRTLQRGAASEVRANGAVQDIPFDEAKFLRRVPGSAYELAVLKSRPLAYWRLDDCGNSEAMISEGRVMAQGLVSPGVSTAVNRTLPGSGVRPAHAALFAGDHDGIEVTDEALGLVANCSCEAWVMPAVAPSGPQRIVSTFDRPRSGMAMGVVDGSWYKLSDEKLRFQFTVYGSYDCVSSTPVRRGEWMHLAATVDAAGTPTLYVDGEQVERRFRPTMAAEELAASRNEVAEWLIEAPTPVGRTTGGLLRIGRNPVGSDGQITAERWQGQISNVAIYDRVLTAAELREHHDAIQMNLTIDGGQRQ